MSLVEDDELAAEDAEVDAPSPEEAAGDTLELASRLEVDNELVVYAKDSDCSELVVANEGAAEVDGTIDVDASVLPEEQSGAS